MPERRMTDIVHQGESFNQINIEPKLRGDGARNLRNFKRMSQPVAEMIGVPPGENLRLGLKPAKSARMNHAVAVTLKVVAVRMRGFGITPPARVLRMDRIRSKGLNHSIIESSDHWKSNCGCRSAIRQADMIQSWPASTSAIFAVSSAGVNGF